MSLVGDRSNGATASQIRGRSFVRSLMLLLFAGSLLNGIGCAHHVTASLAPSPLPIPCSKDPILLYVADGAGNFQACSQAVRAAVERNHLPIEVRTFEWSHGYMRVISDQLCYDYSRMQGQRLAAEMDEAKRKTPNARIHLMAHSAGSTVLLAALEHVTPGTVEHAFILAPSVSSDYDVRPALRNVGDTIHLHYSEHDFWHLGLAVKFVGTTDHMFLTCAAGRAGFRFRPQTEEDHILATKLQQRRWIPSDFLLGNDGGHFGAYRSPYLEQTILPYILGSTPTRE